MSKNRKAHTRPAFNPIPKPVQHVPPGMTYAMTMANQKYRDKQEDKIRLEITGGYLDWMYAALALALKRELGFGAVRTARVIERTQALMLEFGDKEINDKELWKLVKDEVGLDIEPV